MDKYYCIESFWEWKLRRLEPRWSSIPRSINCSQTSASPLISRRIRSRKMTGFGGKLWFDAVFNCGASTIVQVVLRDGKWWILRSGFLLTDSGRAPMSRITGYLTPL